MSTMKDKLRAMLNSNGRTAEEAATFRAKAEELMRKHNISAEELGAKPEQPKAEQPKAKKAKAKKAKPIKDDGRTRVIKVRRKGEKRWSFYSMCSQTDLKDILKTLRAAGYEAKSEVLK